ncbi:hypothetical protein Tco_1476909 [Tanacetum coccineum]
MASFDYRLNPLYAIKECSSCGALYTRNCGCSKGSLEDKILVPVPDSSQQPLILEKICLNCGDPVHGLYCRKCALIRQTLGEVFQNLLNTSESSNDNTNIVSAPQEPFVFNQDPGQNSSRSPPHIDHHCCYECGDSLDDIFCQRCTCKSCGKGAHYGYNCPPQIPIISNPEPCYNQNLNEILQNLQSLQQQCLLGTCQQCGCNEYDGVCFYCTVGNGTPINFSTPYSSNDSPSFANHPPQPQYVPYSSYGSNDILCDMVGQYMQKKEEEKRIAEEQAAKDRIGIPVATLMRGLYHCIDPYYHKEPTIIDSNNDSSSSDDDSYENINYVDDHFRAEIVSLRAFYDNHIEEKSSGSTITHADFSQYDSFIFDISIKPFSLPRGVDFYLEEFADETRSIISLLELAFSIIRVLCCIVQDFPDSEASRAHGFVLQSQELQILSFIWESDILILSTNVYL